MPDIPDVVRKGIAAWVTECAAQKAGPRAADSKDSVVPGPASETASHSATKAKKARSSSVLPTTLSGAVSAKLPKHKRTPAPHKKVVMGYVKVAPRSTGSIPKTKPKTTGNSGKRAGRKMGWVFTGTPVKSTRK